MTSGSWSFSISLWTAVAGAAMIVALLWLFFRGAAGQEGRRLILPEILKLVMGCLLVFTLLRPEWVHTVSKTEKPVVAVVCDASDSMNTRDVVTGSAQAVTRAEWLAGKRATEFWAPLEKRYNVAVTDFAVIPRAVGGVTNEDYGTDIDIALEKALNTRENLRAILLLTDGDWNMGRSPVSAATKLRMRGIPVFTISTGSEKFLPDIELQSVVAPAYALMDERVSIPFTIRSHLDRDVNVVVSLSDAGGVNASKEVRIPAMAQMQDTVLLTPGREGDQTFTLRVPPEKDEVITDNNEKEFRMAFRRETLKVLVVESLPRWEYRYLRNALMRDPGIDVKCLLLHSAGMNVGEGRGYLARFPAGMDELSSYDVVFLGDVGVGDGQLTAENADMIKGLVEKQGSGLVFLPGREGKQASLASSVLRDLMPVELSGAKPGGFGSPMESRLVLTSRGSGHLLTMLSFDPDGNSALWKQLPGFFWHAPVIRARAGSEVLAVHSEARNEYGRIPLLVSRDCGNGKVLFMGTDSAWRWRRGVEDVYHYRFWGQVVRWMAHKRHLAAAEGIRFFFSPELPSRGDRVFLHATVYDDSGFPLQKDARVTAQVKGPDGRVEQLHLSSDPGGWGVFEGSFVAANGGKHDILVKCDEPARQVKTEVLVSTPKREQRGRPSRAEVCREISSITQGRSGSVEDLEKMVESIGILPEAQPVEQRFRLWCHPAWIGFIVLLLALYWGSRKLLGSV